MNRLITLFAVLLFSTSAHAGRVLVFGSSNATGWPRSQLDGGSISKKAGGFLSYVNVFASHIGATVGGTPAPGAFWPGSNPPWPDSCSEPGPPPHSTCPETTYPACLTVAPSVCDMAVSGALMNAISPTSGALPICN
jgi:hypothetical protein